MGVVMRCEFHEGDGETLCQKPALNRVQVGVYAGCWRLCEDHVAPIIVRHATLEWKHCRITVEPLAKVRR